MTVYVDIYVSHDSADHGQIQIKGAKNAEKEKTPTSEGLEGSWREVKPPTVLRSVFL